MKFQEWLKTSDGARCSEYPCTGGYQYLENRLWTAFHAGLNEGIDRVEAALKKPRVESSGTEP